MRNVLIIGGGLAAHQAARGIYETSTDARISLIGAESQQPYDRPHLSKTFLAEEASKLLYLPGSDMYRDDRLALRLHRVAQKIDRSSSAIYLDNGEIVSYDKLIIATGSRARPLSNEICGVQPHYLRTFEDAVSLRAKLVQGRDVVIIGGGFIGLEVAAAARKIGCNVVLLEAREMLLSRSGSRALGDWISRLHAARDVEIQLDTVLQRLERLPSGKTSVEASSGKISADVVVAGVGIEPNVELAQECGLDVRDGIVVDRHCATTDLGIFAAGEVTNYLVSHVGVRTRTESWMAASEQGLAAGRFVAGDETAEYADMPWLWSNQYDCNVQSLGFPQIASKHSLIGDFDSNQWLLLGWSENAQMVSAIAVNKGRDMAIIRRSLKNRAPLPEIYTSAAPYLCS